MKTLIIGNNQSINQAFSELMNEELACSFSFIDPCRVHNKKTPAELNADLIFIDLSSAINDSRDFVKNVRRLKPETPIIALHFYKDMALIEEIMQAGASAYLLVNTSSSELNNAIENILNGDTYISQDI